VISGAYDRMTNSFIMVVIYYSWQDVRSDNAYSNGNSGRFVTAGSMDMVDSDAYPRDTFTPNL
jgi:hypothetical protein